MKREELYLFISDFLVDNARYFEAYNELLVACGSEKLQIDFSLPTDSILAEIRANHLFDDERFCLLLLAKETWSFTKDKDYVDEQIMRIRDEESRYKVGKVLFGYGVRNDYVIKYPYITELIVGSCDVETVKEISLRFDRGINRIKLSSLEEKYDASELASIIMCCLKGVPFPVLNNRIRSDYFVSENFKQALFCGDYSQGTLIATLSFESKDRGCCGGGARACYRVKNGKIISDFYADSRKIKEIDDFFEGLWNNALINKFGVYHGCFADVFALAQKNRYPVLIDMSEIGYDENVLNKLLSLKNQIIILE